MNVQHKGWQRQQINGLAANAGEARLRLDRELDEACALPRSFGQRQRLGDELHRLERLQHLAHLWPTQWQRCIADSTDPLGLWLFGVALGVAGLGLPEASLAMLDVLPGVAGGAQGRRELLESLLAEAEELAPNFANSPIQRSAAGGDR
jgi:hypothetical protein